MGCGASSPAAGVAEPALVRLRMEWRRWQPQGAAGMASSATWTSTRVSPGLDYGTCSSTPSEHDACCSAVIHKLENSAEDAKGVLENLLDVGQSPPAMQPATCAWSRGLCRLPAFALYATWMIMQLESPVQPKHALCLACNCTVHAGSGLSLTLIMVARRELLWWVSCCLC